MAFIRVAGINKADWTAKKMTMVNRKSSLMKILIKKSVKRLKNKKNKICMKLKLNT